MNFKRFSTYKVFSILVLCIWGCSSVNDIDQINPVSNELNKHFVSKSDILGFLSNSQFNGRSQFDSSFFENGIKSIHELPGRDSTTAVYLVNFLNDSGFVFMPADKRISPILAYSKQGNFNTDSILIPVMSIIESYIDMVDSVRDNQIGIDSSILVLWSFPSIHSPFKTMNYYYPPNYFYWCFPNIKTIGPLMRTRWGQGCIYNDFIRSMGCNICGSGGNQNAWVGCVTVAGAQVMNYHQYPSTYSWSMMPIPTVYAPVPFVPSHFVSHFMMDLSQRIGTSYSCSGSGAWPSTLRNVLVNQFNYSANQTYSAFNHANVKRDILQERPVIVDGYAVRSVRTRFLFWKTISLSDGHAWVCDGIRYDDSNCQGSPILYHMNWGWDGTSDGFYRIDGIRFIHQISTITRIHR